jgi:hypothetical protein
VIWPEGAGTVATTGDGGAKGRAAGMSEDRQGQVITSVADATLRLIGLVDRDTPGDRGQPQPRWITSGLALTRLAGLLTAELGTEDDDRELLGLYAGAVMETWLTAHVALLLGQRGEALLQRRARARERLSGPGDLPGPAPSLEGVGLVDMARLLDLEQYGVSEPPKAFQRHLRSFFTEINIRGDDGAWLVDGGSGDVNDVAVASNWTKTDALRVSLWVILFLAHDHFEAAGRNEEAARAYELFQQLRDGTAAFYARGHG